MYSGATPSAAVMAACADLGWPPSSDTYDKVSPACQIAVGLPCTPKPFDGQHCPNWLRYVTTKCAEKLGQKFHNLFHINLVKCVWRCQL